MSSKKELIRMPGGDPDFEAPPHVKEAAIRGIKEGGRYTHYAFSGIPEFKEAVVDYYSKYGVKYDPSDVYPTAGSSIALNVVIANLLGPGDECIVFDPTFGSHHRTPPRFGADVVFVPLDHGDFHLDPDELRKRVTDKAKLLILCNPNNPAGTVHTREELEVIAEVAKENDIVVLADEIYNEFVYDGREHIALSSLPGMRERTIIVMSFSKTFAMTGWRLGYYIAPDELKEKLSAMPFNAAPTSFVQLAGAAALSGPFDAVREMCAEYDKRRRFIVKRLNEIEGVSCHMFEGAFYAYPDISELGVTSATFVKEFMEKENVLISDGSRFGPVVAQGHLRIPLVKPVEVLEEMVQRMERYVKDL